MGVTLADLSAGRSRLQKIADGLRAAAGGEVLERAAAKVQEQITAVSKSKLSAHEASGNALGVAVATHSGGLIQLPAPGYLRFHGWWPFRRGMPTFVVKRASIIFARELLAALGAGGSGAAFDAASEVAEADDASTAKKAAKKIETKRRREDRAYEKRIKAREDREGR